MSKQLVFGHQNPDTDTIAAAISLAYLRQQDGVDVEAVALGEPNAETKFALDYFDTKPLRVITAAKPEVDQVMLVDHNEPQQSVSDLNQVQVTNVVDHHRIHDFNTEKPLYYRAEPVGCSSTILTKMYHEKNVAIPKNIAGLMLSAIISDTLLLKSPTTTDDDKAAVEELAKIAGVDYNDYGIKMLKAGTNIAARSDKDLIDGDAKSFTMNGVNVRIDQINTVDLDDVFARQADIEAAMKDEMHTEGYDLFVVMVTNVLNSDTELLVIGSHTDVVEKAFGKKLENNRMALPGVVSRKKQVVPPLTDAFNA